MLKCTVGAYAEYFAIEFLTILCGFYGQVDVTSAWVAIMSIDWTIYILGGGYTTICRNYVGEALGQGNYLLAKKIVQILPYFELCNWIDSICSSCYI